MASNFRELIRLQGLRGALFRADGPSYGNGRGKTGGPLYTDVVVGSVELYELRVLAAVWLSASRTTLRRRYRI